MNVIATKKDLADWVYDAIEANGGSASIVEVARHIWESHEQELKQSGDLFYTWQYDMRWAAQYLRDEGKCKQASVTRRGLWELAR
jgi:hypothetical protein